MRDAAAANLFRSDDSKDRWMVMRKAEADAYAASDYLLVGSATSTTVTGNARRLASSTRLWRQKICDWAYKVVDHLKMSRETVALACRYLDLHMSRMEIGSVDKEEFELVAITCLCLAIKLNEKRHFRFPPAKNLIESILLISGSSYALEHVQEMELRILSSLQWRVHPPTAKQFLEELSQILVADRVGDMETLYLATYLVELSVLDPSLTVFDQSEIALACWCEAASQQSQPQLVGIDYMLKSCSGSFYSHQAIRRRISSIWSKACPFDDERSPGRRQGSPVSVLRETDPTASCSYLNHPRVLYKKY